VRRAAPTITPEPQNMSDRLRIKTYFCTDFARFGTKACVRELRAGCP
jgi:hypothetical protein